MRAKEKEIKVGVNYNLIDYSSYWQNREYEREAEKIALEKLFSRIPGKEQKTILERGGGFGRLAAIYAPFFKDVIFLEPSEKLLKEAQVNLAAQRNLAFLAGRGEAIPQKNKSTDAALMVRVSHHFQDLNPVLKEINRILKPQGFLILEFANKIHFKARLRAMRKGDFSFCKNLTPFDQRRQSRKDPEVVFLNHHPQAVLNALSENNFKVKKILSVSNFRSPFLKKVLPQKWLLFWEKNTQSILAPFWFGPSIFILARKIDPQ